MSLSQVRTYFENAMTASVPTAKKWEGKFDLENIPRNAADAAYTIVFQDLDSQELNDLRTDDLFDVNIQMFFKGKRDSDSVEDTAYDTAHTFRLEAIKTTRAMIGTNIKNVRLNSIAREELDSNDNSIVLNLNFSVRMIFVP